MKLESLVIADQNAAVNTFPILRVYHDLFLSFIIRMQKYDLKIL